MRWPCRWLVGAMLMVAFGWPQAATATGESQCSAVHVHLDTTIANSDRGPFAGRALGQTFLAEDTVITRITVWRPRNTPGAVGMHLYVVGTNQNQVPDVTQMLLDGPTVTVYDSDPPGQYIEVPFVLDPPLSLPGPGTYAFFMQGESCNSGPVWYILANDTDPYPHGLYWITGRVVSSPCHLRAVDGGENNTDLLFDIEFCDTHPTPTRRQTWGELKVIYR